MTERDLPFSARPEPFVLFLSSRRRARFSWRSWRLCETFFWRWRDRKRSGEADRGCGLPGSYQPWAGSAGIGLRSGLGLRTGEPRTACGRQQAVPIVYQGTRIEMGFRADLIVEDLVIVEIKSVEAIAPVHKKQLLTHLRLADKRLGLLINFNVALIKDGITRIANGMPD